MTFFRKCPCSAVRGLDHEHVRVERGDQAEFLAIFLLAAVGGAEARLRSESWPVRLAVEAWPPVFE